MTTNKQTNADDASLHSLFKCVATVNQNTKKRLFVWMVPAWCLNDAFSIHHILGTYHSRTCQSFYEQFKLFVLFNCSSLGCHFYLFFCLCFFFALQPHQSVMHCRCCCCCFLISEAFPEAPKLWTMLASVYAPLYSHSKLLLFYTVSVECVLMT